MLLNSLKVMTRRSQTVFANQRDELLHSNEKRNRVNETEQPQNSKPCQPIRVAALKNGPEEFFIRPHRGAGRLLKTDASEDGGKAWIVAQRIPSRIDF